MTRYPIAFPALGVGPMHAVDNGYGNTLEWFFADDEGMDSKLGFLFRVSDLTQWLVFDNNGECWRIVGVTVLPPEGTGWKQKIRAFFRRGRRYRITLESQGHVAFEEVLRRVRLAYNREHIVWEAIGIDRKAPTLEEEDFIIEYEIARLMMSKSMLEIVQRLQDLDERRAAEAH